MEGCGVPPKGRHIRAGGDDAPGAAARPLRPSALRRVQGLPPRAGCVRVGEQEAPRAHLASPAATALHGVNLARPVREAHGAPASARCTCHSKALERLPSVQGQRAPRVVVDRRRRRRRRALLEASISRQQHAVVDRHGARTRRRYRPRGVSTDQDKASADDQTAGPRACQDGAVEARGTRVRNQGREAPAAQARVYASLGPSQDDPRASGAPQEGVSCPACRYIFLHFCILGILHGTQTCLDPADAELEKKALLARCERRMAALSQPPPMPSLEQGASINDYPLPKLRRRRHEALTTHKNIMTSLKAPRIYDMPVAGTVYDMRRHPEHWPYTDVDRVWCWPQEYVASLNVAPPDDAPASDDPLAVFVGTDPTLTELPWLAFSHKMQFEPTPASSSTLPPRLHAYRRQKTEGDAYGDGFDASVQAQTKHLVAQVSAQIHFNTQRRRQLEEESRQLPRPVAPPSSAIDYAQLRKHNMALRIQAQYRGHRGRQAAHEIRAQHFVLVRGRAIRKGLCEECADQKAVLLCKSCEESRHFCPQCWVHVHSTRRRKNHVPMPMVAPPKTDHRTLIDSRPPPIVTASPERPLPPTSDMTASAPQPTVDTTSRPLLTDVLAAPHVDTALKLEKPRAVVKPWAKKAKTSVTAASVDALSVQPTMVPAAAAVPQGAEVLGPRNTEIAKSTKEPEAPRATTEAPVVAPTETASVAKPRASADKPWKKKAHSAPTRSVLSADEPVAITDAAPVSTEPTAAPGNEPSSSDPPSAAISPSNVRTSADTASSQPAAIAAADKGKDNKAASMRETSVEVPPSTAPSTEVLASSAPVENTLIAQASNE
ncbi:hypothetical protein SDRG_11317 [Saprolegnia diclina VS20]|uniref:Uncharacterized protein n=1 Tax=Saprolegnia diclina (strain VS20) TaxID=1156394 RepID=T0RMC1_SAPDV|nr:hypothetical protein SDRG_11317 [Saprolegnia diclina VS20]EQC31132.1 hypothetical protein SDRG_11317 [Saprolegnia diclina VS20]|eukprot:XP_008615572.1 hypothetical protein SDRG_11317 [Saprolegnia diclina VS20]